jgi:hypothetical protein
MPPLPISLLRVLLLKHGCCCCCCCCILGKGSNINNRIHYSGTGCSHHIPSTCLTPLDLLPALQH